MMSVMTEAEPQEAILQAADQLFYERGFQAVSMDELRDKAGVPPQANQPATWCEHPHNAADRAVQ